MYLTYSDISQETGLNENQIRYYVKEAKITPAKKCIKGIKRLVLSTEQYAKLVERAQLNDCVDCDSWMDPLPDCLKDKD